jgi:hypothetical protein
LIFQPFAFNLVILLFRIDSKARFNTSEFTGTAENRTSVTDGIKHQYDLLPCFRTKLSMICAKERGRRVCRRAGTRNRSACSGRAIARYRHRSSGRTHAGAEGILPAHLLDSRLQGYETPAVFFQITDLQRFFVQTQTLPPVSAASCSRHAYAHHVLFRQSVALHVVEVTFPRRIRRIPSSPPLLGPPPKLPSTPRVPASAADLGRAMDCEE